MIFSIALFYIAMLLLNRIGKSNFHTSRNIEPLVDFMVILHFPKKNKSSVTIRTEEEVKASKMSCHL